MRYTPYIPDDTYISLRYAENLARGDGLVFNQGERVEGYSNFLWTIVVSFLLNFARNNREKAVRIVVYLSLAYALNCLLGAYLAGGLSTLFIIMCAGPFILYATSGLETSIFACGLVGICIASMPLSLTFAGVLLALTRPEGILAYPIIRLWSHFNGMPIDTVPWDCIIWFVCVSSYHIWRRLYYGRWLPMPFYSKRGLSKTAFPWITNLKYYFFQHNHYFAPCGYYYIALAYLAWLGRQPETQIVFIIAGVYALVYLNFTDWMPAMRYHVPLIAILAVPAGKGVMLYPQIGALFGILSLAYVALVFKDANDAKRELAVGGARLAHEIEKRKLYGTTLAIHDCGIVPYFTGMPTIDINPRSLLDLKIAAIGRRAINVPVKERLNLYKEAILYILSKNPGLVILVSFSTTTVEKKAQFKDLEYAIFNYSAFRKRYTAQFAAVSESKPPRAYWAYVRNDLAGALNEKKDPE